MHFGHVVFTWKSDQPDIGPKGQGNRKILEHQIDSFC